MLFNYGIFSLSLEGCVTMATGSWSRPISPCVIIISAPPQSSSSVDPTYTYEQQSDGEQPVNQSEQLKGFTSIIEGRPAEEGAGLPTVSAAVCVSVSVCVLLCIQKRLALSWSRFWSSEIYSIYYI